MKLNNGFKGQIEVAQNCCELTFIHISIASYIATLILAILEL